MDVIADGLDSSVVTRCHLPPIMHPKIEAVLAEIAVIDQPASATEACLHSAAREVQKSTKGAYHQRFDGLSWVLGDCISTVVKGPMKHRALEKSVSELNTGRRNLRPKELAKSKPEAIPTAVSPAAIPTSIPANSSPRTRFTTAR